MANEGDTTLTDNMVSSNTTEESEGSLQKLKLPNGNYVLISWDLDTTGSRLVDEICQIGAYTPTSTFSQYVMPYRDLTVAARRRHSIRIITIGRFRMLKDVKRGKVLKTKSEISALVDFIQYLKEQKGSKDGVILLRHENRKIAIPLLLEALNKYNLLDDFRSVVVGFADGFAFAENRCSKTVKYFSLRTLARILLHREEDELDHAHGRARAIYEVALNVSGVEGSCDPPETTENSPSPTTRAGEGTTGLLIEALHPFILSTSAEEKELVVLKDTVIRQDSFRPVFVGMLSNQSLRERQRAYNLRSLLVDAGLNHAVVKDSYDKDGADGVKNLLETKIEAKPKDLEDIHKLLIEHFSEDQPKVIESEKTDKRPNRRYYRNRRDRAKSESKNEKVRETLETGEVGAGDAPSNTTIDTSGSTPTKVVGSSRIDDSSPCSTDLEFSPAVSSTR